MSRTLAFPASPGAASASKVPTSALTPSRLTPGATSLCISFAGCTLLTTVFLVEYPQIVHWFVIPALFCGILIGSDAVDWLSGRVGLFDPAGIVGVLGVHFFLLAPLLHVAWDYWLSNERPYVDAPPDWRDWLGYMALLNAAGLVIYRCVRDRVAARVRQSRLSYWKLDAKRLFLAGAVGITVAAIGQYLMYAHFGGVMGYIDAFTYDAKTMDASDAFDTDNALAGLGWLIMVTDCFPILAMICFAVWVKRVPLRLSSFTVGLILLGFFMARMLFGGFHGSRSNTLYALFWAAGIIHLWIRPLSKKFVLVGIGFLFAFMYVYGFYKSLGSDVVAAFQEGATADEVADSTGRTFRGLVLGDLARADVQAFMVYRLSLPNLDYKLALGRTYTGTIAQLVPRALWPDRPPNKRKEGTELQYGIGSYDPNGWASARVYGIAGEAMLNFGPLAAPLAYLVFGVGVGGIRGFLSGLRQGDTRLLLIPFLITLCFWLLVGDSDTFLFVLIKDGLPPALLVWIGSNCLNPTGAGTEEQSA
jgi:hypothetical protein